MHQRVAGIDVHRMKHVVTVLIDREDGAVLSETRAFGGFKRDMRALVAWLQTHRIQQAVMESTGIYWKSVFAHLEAASIPAHKLVRTIFCVLVRRNPTPESRR
jgi:transposase